MAKKSPIEENRNDAVNQNQTVRRQMVEDSGLVFNELNEIITAALKGDVQPLTVLDTEALTNLLGLENVSNVEASIRNGCVRATHFMGSDGQFIYDIGIDNEEIRWEIDEFRAVYPTTWWTIEQVVFN